MKRIHTCDPNIVPTLGVAVTMDGINLYINDYFVEDQTVAGLAECLKHECEHPMRGHFEREKTLEPDLHKKTEKPDSFLDRYKKCNTGALLNMAEDYAINQYLGKDFPKKIRQFDIDGNALKDKDGNDMWFSLCNFEDLNQQFGNKLRPKEAMEYYYRLLKKQQEKNDPDGNGGWPVDKDGNLIITLDEHGIFDESMDKLDPQFAKAIVQKVMNDAKDALTSQQAGNMPSHLKLLLDKLNRASVSWEDELRMFRARCSSTLVEETRRRRNRRYGLLYPGRRPKDITHIVVAIDSSGSTGNGWKQFFSELVSMAATGVKITFVECDAAIQKVCPYDESFVPEVRGGGGTLFKPVFDLLETEEFIQEYGIVNGLVYFTDGENWENHIDPPAYEVLWALMPGCRSRYQWGQKIWIEVKDEAK